MKIVNFPWTNGETPKLGLLLENDTFLKTSWKSSEDFIDFFLQQRQTLESSKILCVKSKNREIFEILHFSFFHFPFFHFSCYFVFSCLFRVFFFFHFFHFSFVHYFIFLFWTLKTENIVERIPIVKNDDFLV